jgi:cytochrome P450
MDPFRRRLEMIQSHTTAHASSSCPVTAAAGGCPFSAGANSAEEMERLHKVEGKMTRVRNRGRTWWIEGYEAARGIITSTTATTVERDMFEPSSPQEAEEFKYTLKFYGKWLLMHDQPRHETLRTIFFRELIPSKIPRFEKHANATAKRLLDEVEARGDNRMLMVKEFSAILPPTMTACLIGAPLDDLPILKEITHIFADIIGKRHTNTARLEMSRKAIPEALEYVKKLYQSYRENPRQEIGADGVFEGKNFITMMLERIDEDPELYKLDEIYANTVLLIFGSADTLFYAIPNAIVALLMNPDQMKWLLEDIDGRIEQSVEELLRFCGPGGVTARLTTRDILVNGNQMIKKGDVVLFDVHECNRDPDKFENPNKLDLKRGGQTIDGQEHFVFGDGHHRCLGRNLARLQMRVALTHVLKRFPNMRLAVNQVSMTTADGPVPGDELKASDAVTTVGWDEVPVFLR